MKKVANKYVAKKFWQKSWDEKNICEEKIFCQQNCEYCYRKIVSITTRGKCGWRTYAIMDKGSRSGSGSGISNALVVN